MILNHFFAHAPYLLDAGWYSDIVYRAGVFPKNPTIACDYAEWYYGVHPSAYVSLFSILSYLSPLPRIEWYALFQVTVFLPFAWAVYALVAKVQPIRSWAGIAIATLAALAFTFSGQILRMIPYPHYEVAIPAYICLMLVMLTTGRQRWAWVFFALALSIREDAGVHTAMALLPLVYLKWRGTELAPRMRTLLVMCGVGIGVTVIGSLSQKLVFHGPSIMGIVYLGDPIYSHINGAEIARRAAGFFAESKFLFYPFLATCVLAAARRDARYLLGWLAGAPWFLLNFLAAQPQKSTFEAYSGFPYIVSVFWVLLYGSVLAPESRRIRTLVLEGGVRGHLPDLDGRHVPVEPRSDDQLVARAPLPAAQPPCRSRVRRRARQASERARAPPDRLRDRIARARIRPRSRRGLRARGARRGYDRVPRSIGVPRFARARPDRESPRYLHARRSHRHLHLPARSAAHRGCSTA